DHDPGSFVGDPVVGRKRSILFVGAMPCIAQHKQVAVLRAMHGIAPTHLCRPRLNDYDEERGTAVWAGGFQVTSQEPLQH
ncbi:MAG TPA: hypothetical protein V6C69_17230, partial [Trichormus sp.]